MGAGGALPEACQMTLWFVFALMTVAAIFAVLLPLGRGGRAQGQDSPNQGSEVAVYKDQLAEVERDLAAGLIAAPEAEAARVEISRRLLAAAASEPADAPKSSLKWRRSAAVLALVGLPLVAIGVYMPLGSPLLQDFPLAQRERGLDISYQYLLKAGDDIVGRINLTGVQRVAFNKASLGYRIGEAYAGQGVASRAVALLLEEAYGKLDFWRIEANSRPENAASVRVLERNGFTQCGRTTRSMYHQGAWYDQLLFERHRDGY